MTAIIPRLLISLLLLSTTSLSSIEAKYNFIYSPLGPASLALNGGATGHTGAPALLKGNTCAIVYLVPSHWNCQQVRRIETECLGLSNGGTNLPPQQSSQRHYTPSKFECHQNW